MYKRKGFIIMLVLSVVLFQAACIQEDNSVKDRSDKTEIGDTGNDLVGVVDNSPLPVKDPVEEMIAEMSIQEKIGQLFILCYRKDDSGNPILKLNDGIEDSLKLFHPGGVVLFSENLDSIKQTKDLIDSLQEESTIPLFVAIDEEGGDIVKRLNSSDKLHSTHFPNNMDIGDTMNPDLAFRVGQAIGEEISSLGFNMNFAPVADINTNPDNPVIGKRSYGDNPKEVAKMVSAAVQGMHAANVLTVIKHFPGHGDTSVDSHSGEVIIKHNLERLKSVEFLPFKAGILAGTDGVMTAHIRTPNATNNDLPATLSSEVLSGMLREQLGFKGIIVTDALDMAAITKYYSDSEAAVSAIEAGADMLLIPNSVEDSYNGIMEAVKSGRIKEERINQSVERILRSKNEYDILDNDRDTPEPETTMGCEEHLRLVEEIEKQKKK